MTSHSRPGRLEDVRIAVICALPREFDAAILAFDETWNGDEDEPTIAQCHNHKMGRIGSHVVVLVLLPNMGKVSAATETARLRSLYPKLELAVLTGICGGVPSPGTDNEILLGDVVISKSIVQYDIGRQYPGKFVRKDTVDDSLGRPNKDIRTLLVVLETQLGLKELQHRVNQNLAHIQQMAIEARYRTCYTRPSAAEDVLFEPTYSHIHRDHRRCDCSDSTACNGAISASCEELQCEVGHQVSRRRLAFENERNLGQVENITHTPESWIHIGCIGSGDIVMKSGKHRDSVAKEHGLIAFEMEGAGVWDEIPCIVVKGVCDYADSHKNKKWQDFAAATAAAATRALLERFPRKNRLGTADTHLMPQRAPVKPVNVAQQPSHPVHYVIPLEKNRRFIERAVTSHLKQMLFDEKRRTVALVGLGGVGKTQIALDIAYWVKDNKTEYSVFWVPALSFASFEQAYTVIAKDLDIYPQTESEDVKTSVRQFLSSKAAGHWLLIVDNADDEEILFGSSGNPNGLDKYLPQSDNGITLFTTRLRDLALSVADDSLAELHEMNQGEARSLLAKSLHRQELLQDHDSVLRLLKSLTHLPLAITQASAYLNRNRHMSISKYLQLLHGTDRTRISTLSREFLDRTRYPDSRNAIATTWLVSFDQIQRTDSYATDLLYFISRIEPKSIPRSILHCSGSEEDTEYAIGTLCSYTFLVQQDDAQSFDMHSLVHLAARIWAKKQSIEERIAVGAVKHLGEIFPSSSHENRNTWRQYMPHVLKLWDEQMEVGTELHLNLYSHVSECLLEDGRTKKAIELMKYIVEVRERTFDEGHPDRLTSQHQLAVTYREDGRIKEAVKILEHVVEVKATILDEGHPGRLVSQHELATAYQADGRVKEAVKILEHVVEVEATILNEEHPHQLASQHELATAYQADGRVKEAVKILEHVVGVRAALDEGHPDRLASQHELARAYQADGRVKEAVKILEHVVEVEATTLDEGRPDRLASQHALAIAYQQDGQVKKAIKILEHVVEVEATTLDEGHPDRLASQHALAQAYQAHGRIEDLL